MRRVFSSEDNQLDEVKTHGLVLLRSGENEVRVGVDCFVFGLELVDDLSEIVHTNDVSFILSLIWTDS